MEYRSTSQFFRLRPRTRNERRLQQPFQQLEFSVAAENGDLLIMDRLLSDCEINGVDINGETSGTAETALNIAAQEGHEHVVQYLVGYGNCDLNHQNLDHQTALQVATRKGQYKIATTLIHAGADVNIPDRRRKTPIFYAALNNYVVILNALLSANADIHWRDEDGCSALHEAIASGHIECVKALIKAKADIHATDRRGRTPLELSRQAYKEIKRGRPILSFYSLPPFHPDKVLFNGIVCKLRRRYKSSKTHDQLQADCVHDYNHIVKYLQNTLNDSIVTLLNNSR